MTTKQRLLLARLIIAFGIPAAGFIAAVVSVAQLPVIDRPAAAQAAVVAAAVGAVGGGVLLVFYKKPIFVDLDEYERRRAGGGRFGIVAPLSVGATLMLNALAAPSFLTSLSAGLGGLTVVLYAVGLVRAYGRKNSVKT